MSPPRVAVVLASLRPRRIVEASLEALAPQCRRAGVTLLVARRATDADESWLSEQFPGCRVIRCDPTAGVPGVRGAGLDAADGDWVLLTEDNCVAANDWVVRMQEQMTDGVGVIGGAMGNAATARPIDWGAFFAEYGFFGATDGDDAATLATGANVAYRRDLLPLVASLSLAGSWEDVIHNRLAEADVRFGHAPHAVVRQQLSYELRSFMHDRFVHGRDYARARSRTLGRPHRLLRAFGSVFLPAVLAARIWQRTGRRTPRAFVRALPATMIFLLAWATGEAAGYLHGADADA